MKKSRLNIFKQRKLIALFIAETTARKAAEITGVNRNTAREYFTKLRRIIFDSTLQERSLIFKGKVELDESYFGARRTKGKKGRGALGKTIVFGILERDKKIYTKIVPDCKAKTLQAIIKGHVDAKSIIYTDGWPAYNGLVDVGYKKHFLIQHSENQFAKGKCHVNGIESFWS